MNEIEAISVLETRIKYPNSDTYGGMCEAEYQQEAVVLALEALREKLERSKGCVWCKEDNKVFHDGKHFHMFCSYCGKRLEVEHEQLL